MIAAELPPSGCIHYANEALRSPFIDTVSKDIFDRFFLFTEQRDHPSCEQFNSKAARFITRKVNGAKNLKRWALRFKHCRQVIIIRVVITKCNRNAGQGHFSGSPVFCPAARKKKGKNK